MILQGEDPATSERLAAKNCHWSERKSEHPINFVCVIFWVVSILAIAMSFVQSVNAGPLPSAVIEQFLYDRESAPNQVQYSQNRLLH